MELTHRHPEWKRLYDELSPGIKAGDFFSYEELRFLLGLDAQTPTGRKQLHRCAKELLVTHNCCLENVVGKGYRVIQPNEHARSGSEQLKRARNRIRKGAAIVVHTDLEALTDQARKENADVLCRLAMVERTTTETLREVRKIAASIAKPQRLPSPMELRPKHVF